jgi:hypothetical protein
MLIFFNESDFTTSTGSLGDKYEESSSGLPIVAERPILWNFPARSSNLSNATENCEPLSFWQLS